MKSITFFYFIIFLTIGYGCKKKRPVPKSSVKEIVSFSFRTIENSGLSASFSGAISNDSIIVKVVKGTQVTSLIPVIYFTGEKISPSDKAAQDFTKPVQYTVTAADGSLNWNYNNMLQINTYAPAPAAANGVVYVCRENDAKLYAFHAGTGNIKWIFPGNGRMNTSVCIIDSKGTVFNSGDSGDQN